MKNMNKKHLIAVVSILLLLAVAVSGTVAYLAAVSGPLVNTFTPSEVGVTVTDEVEDGVKKEVVITNTGKTSAYIRARIVGSWVNDDGITVQAWDPAPYDKGGDGDFVGLPGTDWVQSGDYYYYTKPVLPNGTTDSLFTKYTVTEEVNGAHLVLDILVQAIQSEGGAAQEAWRVDLSAPQ